MDKFIKDVGDIVASKVASKDEEDAIHPFGE